MDEIADMVAARASSSDDAVLAELAALSPLPHYDDSVWDDGNSQAWHDLTLYRVLCEVIAIRKLKQAIPLLLERACAGDPGELMRNLPDYLWSTAGPDLDFLIRTYLASTKALWDGARMWAIDGLGQLRRFRAADLDAGKALAIDEALKTALTDEDRIVRMAASSWLSRMHEISG